MNNLLSRLRRGAGIVRRQKWQNAGRRVQTILVPKPENSCPRNFTVKHAKTTESSAEITLESKAALSKSHDRQDGRLQRIRQPWPGVDSLALEKEIRATAQCDWVVLSQSTRFDARAPGDGPAKTFLERHRRLPIQQLRRLARIQTPPRLPVRPSSVPGDAARETARSRDQFHQIGDANFAAGSQVGRRGLVHLLGRGHHAVRRVIDIQKLAAGPACSPAGNTGLVLLGGRVTIFVTQRNELRTLRDVPASAFALEETPVMSALLRPARVFAMMTLFRKAPFLLPVAKSKAVISGISREEIDNAPLAQLDRA